MCVLRAPSVYLISLWVFLFFPPPPLAQQKQSEVNYFNKMKGWSAFQCCLVVSLFALPECVRAAVGAPGLSPAPQIWWTLRVLSARLLGGGGGGCGHVLRPLTGAAAKGPLSSRHSFPRHLRTVLSTFWPRLFLGNSLQSCMWGNVLMCSSVSMSALSSLCKWGTLWLCG